MLEPEQDNDWDIIYALLRAWCIVMALTYRGWTLYTLVALLVGTCYLDTIQHGRIPNWVLLTLAVLVAYWAGYSHTN